MRLVCTNTDMWFEGSGAERTVALRDVNLDVASGEVVCLLGPSGCGKSTLLRLLAGLEQASAGHVQEEAEDGRIRDIRGPDPRRGMIFQDVHLFPWRTARRNVEFSLECAGVPRAQRRERAARLLEMVGLGKWGNAFPSQMSGGMRQRVGIARAIAGEPRVLLMDEPFAALDEPTRQAMQEETLRIHKEFRTTVVFVTHSIEEAVYLGQRIVVMSPHPGRVERVIDVDLPFPRDRVSPEFIELRREIAELMERLHAH